MAEPIHIALVDDDSAVLDSLQLYFARHRVSASCFASAEALLTSLDGGAIPDCIVSDIRMPGMSGLDLIHRLRERRAAVPLILITGLGDIEMAVSAIKNGAADFIEKPFDDQVLIDAIHSALANRNQAAAAHPQSAEIRKHLSTLSERERQVLEGLVSGLPNKTIAYDLGISPRTVEIHRANVMSKMGAGSLSHLVRMALIVDLKA